IVPVVVSFLVRGTALAWAAVPVLAIVTAGAAWIIAVNVSANMPAATTTPTQAVDELPSITSTDVALPTTQEKPTVADEASSATAALLGFSYLFSIWPGGPQLQLSVPYRSDRA